MDRITRTLYDLRVLEGEVMLVCWFCGEKIGKHNTYIRMVQGIHREVCEFCKDVVQDDKDYNLYVHLN